MNVANLITLTRLVLTVVCFVCLELVPDRAAPPPALAWWAFGLFVFAAATDFVDGYIARKYGLVTKFGRVADPFADKVLICGTLILLLTFPQVSAVLPSWFVLIVVGREFLVTTLRGLAESSGVEFPAERVGKWKMVAQSVTCAAMLTMVAGASIWELFAEYGMWVTLVLTVWSCLGYVFKARRVLSDI